MKKYVFLICIFLGIIFFFISKDQSTCKNKEAVIYRLGNKNYCLLVADSSKKWTTGLMGYKKPIDFDGMIFIFPNKGIQRFWNMNTYLDLDIYWLDDEKIVGKSFLPSIERSKEIIYISSPRKANKVIEIIK